MRSSLRLAFSLIGVALGIICANADEFSIIWESTIIGRNYGYPNGTPTRGNTLVREIDLVLETAVYFKNLELTGFDLARDGIEGETFFGSLLPLRVRYRAHEKITFEAGAVLGKDFGDANTLNVIEPLLRLVYEPTNDVFLISGTILPTHWIHDAIHDDVQKFRTNAEQGLQIRADLDWLKQDAWINWRIREDEFTAEKFEVGSTTQLRFFSSALWVEAQILWAHTGGQINVTDRIENNVTLLGGISYSFTNPFGWECFDELRIGANYLHSKDDTRGAPPVFGNGYEIFATLRISQWKNMSLRLNTLLFSSNDFIARRGDPLYGLDFYAQLGVVALFKLPSGLRLESGIVGQYTDDRLNYTYFINFTWGQGFAIDFLSPR